MTKNEMIQMDSISESIAALKEHCGETVKSIVQVGVKVSDLVGEFLSNEHLKNKFKEFTFEKVIDASQSISTVKNKAMWNYCIIEYISAVCEARVVSLIEKDNPHLNISTSVRTDYDGLTGEVRLIVLLSSS